ncbi:MAG: OmpH family outer membrane protein [Bacteroidota bacterium]
MKKLTSLLGLIVLSATFAMAQRVAYVDTDYIMSKIEAYGAAQQEVENISQQWQKELEAKYQAIEQMYADYQAQEVLLPEDVKRQEQEKIFQAEREAKEYREKKFGYNGELFSLQESRIKPIQEKVFRATETIAKRKKFSLVFDKAGEVTWLYTDATYDLSNDVLEELGVELDNN